VEELSGNSVVIFTASGEGGVLDTIKSRCQRIFFNLKSEGEIKEFINNANLTDLEITSLSKVRGKTEQRKELTKSVNGVSRGSFDKEVCQTGDSDVVFLARGRVKEAERLLIDSSYREERIKKLEGFKKALRGDLKAGFQIAHDETKDKQSFAEYLVDWNYYLSSFLKQNVLEDKDIRIQKKVFQISKQLNEAREILRSNQNANPRLLLENFFVQIK
jgi:hypothetical protein